MIFNGLLWWFPFSGACLGFLCREAYVLGGSAATHTSLPLSLQSITEWPTVLAVQTNELNTSQRHFPPLPPSQRAGFPLAILFLKGTSHGKNEERQDSRLSHTYRRKLVSLSVSLEDGPGVCFSSFWEAIRISYNRQDWMLAQLAGLGTKDPQGEVPCLSSQWMLALTLDHFSVSFLYLGSFGWSLRSVLSFTSALMTGLSCLAAFPRGPWCSMGPAYSKTEREQPVVSSQRNGDKSASVSRVFLFWSLGSCFF